jgi:hypothetical protein
MDWSWLHDVSGGGDVLPIPIALFAVTGIVLSLKLPKADTLEERFANLLAMICFIALPIAQIGWVSSVIRGVPALGSIMDNVWTIYNFASLGALLLFQHGRKK